MRIISSSSLKYTTYVYAPLVHKHIFSTESHRIWFGTMTLFTVINNIGVRYFDEYTPETIFDLTQCCVKELVVSHKCDRHSREKSMQTQLASTSALRTMATLVTVKIYPVFVLHAKSDYPLVHITNYWLSREPQDFSESKPAISDQACVTYSKNGRGRSFGGQTVTHLCLQVLKQKK